MNWLINSGGALLALGIGAAILAGGFLSYAIFWSSARREGWREGHEAGYSLGWRCAKTEENPPEAGK